jgi:hypothetical protein
MPPRDATVPVKQRLRALLPGTARDAAENAVFRAIPIKVLICNMRS